MSVSQYFITLDSDCDKNAGGGKFFGLTQLKPLIAKYNREYNLGFKVPESVAITTNAFEELCLQDNPVPDALVNEAMQYAVKLGGNVAVRSSADVEDKSGKTHSGEFASVLCVKKKAEMAAALNKVYKSAQNVAGAKMGIVLQTMIAEPQMAGVVYSETVTGKPYIVINFVDNKLAENLLNNEDMGITFLIDKYVENPTGEKERLDLENVNKPEYQKFFISCHGEREDVPAENFLEYQKQFMLAALVNQLEEDLGYPIDMEFAVAKNGEINILQQRAYLLPKFYKKDISKDITVCYQPLKAIAEGEVSVLKYLEIAVKRMQDIIVYKEKKSSIVNVYTHNSYVTKIGIMSAEENLFSNMLYTHYGNQRRENFDFTNMEVRGEQVKGFDNLEAGFYYFMEVNFATGKYNYMPANNGEKIFDRDASIDYLRLNRLIDKYNGNYGYNVRIPKYEEKEIYSLNIPDRISDECVFYFSEKLAKKIGCRAREVQTREEKQALIAQIDSFNVSSQFVIQEKVKQAQMRGKVFEPLNGEDKIGIEMGDAFFPLVVYKYVENPAGEKERLSLENVNKPEYKKFLINRKMWNQEVASAEVFSEYQKQFILAALFNQLEEDLGYPIEMEYAISEKGEINVLQCQPAYIPRSYTKEIEEEKKTSWFEPDKTVIEGEVSLITRQPIGVGEWARDVIVYKDEKNGIVNFYSKKAYRTELFYKHCNIGDDPCRDIDLLYAWKMNRSDLEFCKLETRGCWEEYQGIKDGSRVRIDLKKGTVEILPERGKQESDLTMMKRDEGR